MWYLIEEYRWDEDNGYKYYHLNDSKLFESDKPLKEETRFKDGSSFIISKVNEDEIQTTRRRNSKK
jgi:hypothetical protein